MQKLLNDCVGWLNWKVVAIGLLFGIGVMLWAESSVWAVWLSATPLLAIALCVLPCLIPLLWLWRKGKDGNSV